jgi:hypothetical protein
VLVDGYFYGWFTAPGIGEPQAELVGYAGDGSQVGRTTI